jgi:hypothetical protein
MPMCKVIRVGGGHTLIVAITPAAASPHAPGVKSYIRRSWPLGPEESGKFHQIAASHAQAAMSGHDDSWGFEELPTRPFKSLDEVAEWMDAKLKVKA